MTPVRMSIRCRKRREEKEKKAKPNYETEMIRKIEIDFVSILLLLLDAFNVDFIIKAHVSSHVGLTCPYAVPYKVYLRKDQ